MSLRLNPLQLFRAAAVRRTLLAGILYFAVAAITISATSDGRNHAAIWLADAVLLAALLSLPRHQWGLALLVGIAANHFANDVTRGFEPAHVLYGAINAAQVWVAAVLLRSSPGESLLTDLRSLTRFLLCAGLAAPFMGAALGSTVSVTLYGQDFTTSFVRWFASNSLGLFVATPFFKGLFDGSMQATLRQQGPTQSGRLGIALLLFSLVVYVTFSQQHLPLLFLPVCALVMVAIWLGRVGVKVSVLILAIVATGSTLQGYGPLNLLGVDEFRTITFFQIYLAVVLVTGLVVATIVTARSDAMARLAEREQMLRQLLLNGKDVILSFDAAGSCQFCGGPAKSLLGMDSGEIVGRSIIDLAQRIAMPLAMLDAMRYADRPVPFSLEFPLAGSRQTWLEGSLAPIVVDDVLTSSVITLRDITVQRLETEDLSRRAHTDELTQTLNRAGFDRVLDTAIRSGRAVTLALVDIDHFKAVNDTYGHASGDEALVVVAEIITAHVRGGDAVSRIGGDEFAILFQSGPDTALAACERIRACVAETRIFATDRRQMRVTISCGVAPLGEAGGRAILFEAADRALYEAKHQGRNAARQAA